MSFWCPFLSTCLATYHSNIGVQSIKVTEWHPHTLLNDKLAFVGQSLTVLVFGLQALNVRVPDWESFGSMWPHIHNRVLCALVVAQITGLGYFSVKTFPYTPIVVILPVLSWCFYLFCKRNYYPSFAVVSLYVASEVTKEMPTMNSITEAYTPIYLLPSTIADTRIDDHGSRAPDYTGIVNTVENLV